MKRSILQKLYAWKASENRKPLLLLGARQVGKTWILREFGRQAYNEVHFFDFSEKNADLSVIFNNSSEPAQILSSLSILQEKRIDPDKDLVVFDEIQEEPAALKSLKYFSEQMKYLNLVCAGSLLGVGLSNESFPVGKVEYLEMFPMSFQEFLAAAASEFLVEEYENAFENNETSMILHKKLMDFLRGFLLTGGMPAVVSAYIAAQADKASAFKFARKIQNDLIKDYENDFGKHAGKINAVHLQIVFENIPLQLASNVDESVRRYYFKDVIPGKKGFGPVEGPVSWLEKAGLVFKVPICNKAAMPLKAYTKSNLFKLHVFDSGILGAMLELSPAVILNNDYGTTKGFFMESFVLSELKKSFSSRIYSWSERNSEIEFLINPEDRIIPIEVKSGQRTKAKSLGVYIEKYSPDLAVKFADVPLSPRSSSHKGSSPVRQIPLYFADRLNEMIGSAKGA